MGEKVGGRKGRKEGRMNTSMDAWMGEKKERKKVKERSLEVQEFKKERQKQVRLDVGRDWTVGPE